MRSCPSPWRTGLWLLLAAAVAGCAADPSPPPAAIVHVRDEGGFFSNAVQMRAEAELRAIAAETGLYAVVVTVHPDQVVDPPRVYSPIINEIERRGGRAYVLLVGHGAGFSAELAAVELDAPVWLEQDTFGRTADRGLEEWVRRVRAAAGQS